MSEIEKIYLLLTFAQLVLILDTIVFIFIIFIFTEPLLVSLRNRNRSVDK